MKAAVIHDFGQTPRYEDFSEPLPAADETLVTVQAVVLENFEKGITSGKHYASKSFYPAFPAIVGNRGIGMTQDGRLVSFHDTRPPFGGFAEKAVVKNFISVPGGIDPGLAAALPPSALSSYFPLKYAAGIENGETVLINGATGVSGRLALQVAKLLGAGRVVGTGRNDLSLGQIRSLGADAVIDLKAKDGDILKGLEKEKGNGYDIVIDFLWGRPAELILQTLVPRSLGIPAKPVRYIHVGAMAGPAASITGEMLRTSGLQLSGFGKVTPEDITSGISQIWEWIKESKLRMDIEKIPLADIAAAWHHNDLAGRRIVLIPL